MALTSLGIDVSILGDKAQFDKTISEVNKEISKLGREVTKFNNRYKLLGNIEDLEKKLETLRKKQAGLIDTISAYNERIEYLKENGGVEKHGEEIEALQKRLEKAENSWLSTEVAIRKTQEQLEKLNSVEEITITDLELLQTELELVGEKFTSIGRSVSTVGNAFRGVSEAAYQFLNEGASAAIDYESSLANLQRTLDKTGHTEYGFGQYIKEVDQSIRELSTNIPATADEIADIVSLMAQLGVEDKNLLKFSEVMIGLSNTTNLSAESAGEAIAKFYNIVGSDMETVDNFASALLTLGVRAAATESEITEMAFRIGAAANRVGMSEQEILAFATALSSVGLQAAGGGGAISKILTNIDKAVTNNSKKLYEWAEISGMTAKQFKQAWGEDAAGTFNAVIVGMAKVLDEGGNLNKVLSDLGIEEIRQLDVLGRLAGKEDSLSKYIEISNKAWEENVALGDATSLIYGTVASQTQIMQNTLEEFKRELGDVLLPIIAEFNKMLKGVFDWFISLDPAMKQTITVILAITSAIAPILLFIGNLLTKFGQLSFFTSELLTKYPALTGVISGVKGAFSSAIAPVSGIIAVIVLLLATSEKFRKSVANLIKKVWDNGLKPVFDTVIYLLKWVWEFIDKMVIPTISIVGDTIAPVIDIISDLCDIIGVILKPLLVVVTSLVSLLATAFGEVLVGVINIVLGVVEALVNWIKSLWDVMSQSDAFQTMITGLGSVADMLSVVIGWVQSAFDWFGGLLNKAREFLGLDKKFDEKTVTSIARANHVVADAGFFGSGGFGSFNPNITINVTNNGQDITPSVIRGWADIINEELGRAV